MIQIVAGAIVTIMLFGNTPVTEQRTTESSTKAEETVNWIAEIDRPQVVVEKQVEQSVEQPVVEQPVVEQPVIEVPVVKQPEELPVAEEPKQEKAYSVLLGTYSTRYTGADTLNRNYNMRLAINSINQMILKPGENFSYNDVILAKSHNGKDYKAAGILVNGKASTGIGGGICQVSSTLYQASLYSGMTITQRQSHSKPVSYLPKGTDATVSWGELDYKFRNDLKVPVKIQAAMNYGTITIDFFAQENPNLGKIQVTVEKTPKGYVIRRLRNGVVDHVSTSRYR